jgi:Sulfotransferase domain
MLKVVGAGLGRTGTMSLKLALGRLLGKPCYHMSEVFSHPEHIPLWDAAIRGDRIDWSEILDGFEAAVDWPASAFWLELSNLYPHSLVILSYRDPDSWWKSVSSTIFPQHKNEPESEWRTMVTALLRDKFTPDTTNREACIEAFNQHNEFVRNAGLGTRLLEWKASDGWEPLCGALDLPIPEEPFPYVNSTADFKQRHS